MITRLRVQNFKSLRDIDLKFEDITILVGDNNSGKSAAMEALMYYQEAVKSNVSSPENLSDVDYVGYQFNDPDELYFRGDGETADHIYVSPTFDFSHLNDPYKLKNRLEGISGLETDPLRYETSIEFSENTVSQDIYHVNTENERANTLLKHDSGVTGQDATFISPLAEDEQFLAHYDGVFDYAGAGSPDGRELFETLDEYNKLKLGQTHFITDHRKVNELSDTPKEREFVGHSGEHTVSMLQALKDHEDIFDRVISGMKDIAGEEQKILANFDEEDTKTELLDESTGDKYNIVSSGAGYRKILPIIVQVAATKPGGTILIEEPEIGIYPITQLPLVKFLVEQVRERDIQIILSTHSVVTLKILQTSLDDEFGHGYTFYKDGAETKFREGPYELLGTIEDFEGAEISIEFAEDSD